MKVADIMTRDVRTATPQTSLADAARMMAEVDAGAVPVCDGDRVIGMVTDRDIVIRGLAKGSGPETSVTQVMSREVQSCAQDDEFEEVCQKMSDSQIRRLPVLDGGRLVGIVSLGDVAITGRDKISGEALEHISRPN